MESLKRFYEILGVRLRASHEKIRKLPALKTELDRGESAEKALLDEVAAAKKKIERLAADKTDVEKALADARTFARQEAERSAAEREAAANEFTERLAAVQAEVYRITAEKAIAEKYLKEELLKVRTDLEGLVVERTPATIVSTEGRGTAKTGAVIPGSANRIPTKFVTGLVCSELAVAVGILVYVITTSHHPVSLPILEAGDTRKAAPSPADAKQAVVPAPVDGKSVLTDSSVGKSPATVPAIGKTRSPAPSSKKMYAVTASRKGVSGRKRNAVERPVHRTPLAKAGRESETAATAASSASPAVKPDVAKDADGLKQQKKYRVDMYPFARY